MYDVNSLFSLIFATILLIIIAYVVFSCIKIVKQQTAVIVESFGKYHTTLGPGLHFLIPIVHTIRSVLDLRIQEIKSEVDVKTQDNAFVKLPIALQISIDPDNADSAFYKLNNPAPQITSWILNSVRSTTAQMNFQDLYNDKEHLITEVRNLLVTKLKSFGYNIEGILIDQPKIEKDMEHSFNRIITAKREAEAATEEAKATVIREVGIAEAEAQSQRVKAQGMADSREILAKGLAESIARLEGQNIDPELSVTTLLQLNRFDTIKDAASHGNTIIFDISDNKTKDLLPILVTDKINKQ